MTHSYRLVAVPVAGGDLAVGVWEPIGTARADVLLVHGITSSHLVWTELARRLPGVRLIAPDLRGRGRSEVDGESGLAAHADDLDAVLEALGIPRALVVGHSMGAFVAVVLAHRHPDRVARLLLIDGGLPLDVPAGLDPDRLIGDILGPTAARLSMRFDGEDDYFDFWREHPAFAGAWSEALERYFAYDLVDDGEGGLRPVTRYETAAADTVDMNRGRALPEALAALAHPTTLVTVPRGLRGEPPGLYAPEYLARILPDHPGVVHERRDGFNHYTILLTAAGAEAVAPYVVRELAAP